MIGRTAGARVGTNLEYAAIHEFGGTIEAKNAPRLVFQVAPGEWRTAQSVTIPARPYMRPAADQSRGPAFATIGRVVGTLVEARLR